MVMSGCNIVMRIKHFLNSVDVTDLLSMQNQHMIISINKDVHLP